MDKVNLFRNILFIILLLFFSVCLGGLVGGLTLPENTGLEGTAVVLMYAALGGFISMVTGILVIRHSSKNFIIKANKLLFAIDLGIVILFVFRIQQVSSRN